MQNTSNEYKGKIEIVDRERITIDGVASILTFDDKYVLLDTNTKDLFIEGENLVVIDLNKDSKRIIITGMINTLGFIDKRMKRKKGILS